MKITCWRLQKIHIDYNKVLNHSYIIILHIHSNNVACRRTFGLDVTKCSQLQAPPQCTNVILTFLMCMHAPVQESKWCRTRGANTLFEQKLDLHDDLQFLGLFNHASKWQAAASENPTPDISNLQHLQNDWHGPCQPLAMNMLNVCGAAPGVQNQAFNGRFYAIT